MKPNMGFIDRLLRVVIAVMIAVAYFDHRITGVVGVVAMVLAVVFLITAFVGFCPLYKPFGISTRKTKTAA